MLETKGLTWEELENLGFTVITDKNGKKRIDFTKPPKGETFVPLPADDEYIKLKEVDRRFISRRHKFSATTTTVVMELIDEEKEEFKVEEYIKVEKREAKKIERKKRCRYVSPETGNETYCPDCISCYSDDCPKKQGIKTWKEETECLDDIGEFIKSSAASNDPVADEAIINTMWSDFKKSLKKDLPTLADIIEWDEYGYRPREILRMLKRKETDTSWYYYQWKRIRDRWLKYYND